MYLFITKDFESYINNTDMANDFDKVVKDYRQYGGLYLLMDNPAANFDNDFNNLITFCWPTTSSKVCGRRTE